MGANKGNILVLESSSTIRKLYEAHNSQFSSWVSKLVSKGYSFILLKDPSQKPEENIETISEFLLEQFFDKETIIVQPWQYLITIDKCTYYCCAFLAYTINTLDLPPLNY